MHAVQLETIGINMIKTIEPQIGAVALTYDVTRAHKPFGYAAIKW